MAQKVRELNRTIMFAASQGDVVGFGLLRKSRNDISGDFPLLVPLQPFPPFFVPAADFLNPWYVECVPVDFCVITMGLRLVQRSCPFCMVSRNSADSQEMEN